MKIQLIKFACYYMLISFLIDPISVFWKGPSLVVFGDIFLILVTTYIIIKRSYKKCLTWLIVLLFISFIGMISVLRYGCDFDNILILFRNRPIFIFVLTIFFYTHVLSLLDYDQLKKYDVFIERIIQLNIAVLFLEGIALNIFGMSDILIKNFYDEGYRIARYYGLAGIPPNGLVFGRQNASIISIIGLIRWLPWNYEKLKIDLKNIFWISASIVTWILTMTTTSIICFVFIVAVIYFFGLARKHRWIIICCLLLFPFFTFQFYDDYLIYKVDNFKKSEDIKLYLKELAFAFEQPIKIIKEQPFEALIGSGNLQEKKRQTYSENYFAKIESADFGFLIMVIKYGGILLFMVLFSYIIFSIKSVVFFINSKYRRKGIEHIAFKSYITTLLLALSMVHYITMLNNGIMQLFASTLALSYVLIKRAYNP